MSMADLEIRFEKDAAVITALNEQVHALHQEKHPNIFAPYDFEAFYPWYARMLEEENAYAVIAYYRQQPVGYALLFHKINNSPFLARTYESMHIDQMGVLPEFQGRAIGKKLMQFIGEFCREKEVHRLQLSVWLDNELAIAFYKELGFRGYLQYMERDAFLP